MQRLPGADLQEWCRGRGIRLVDPAGVELDPIGVSIDVKFETVSLLQVLRLIESLVPNWVDSPFAGGVVIPDPFGHWSENDDATGRRLLELMVSTAQTTFEPGHGLLFEVHEHADIQIAVLTPIIAGWDAIVVPADGAFAVELSHDGVATVRCRTEQILAEMERRFRALGLRTEVGAPLTFPPKTQ